MRRIFEDFLHKLTIKDLNPSAVTGCGSSSLAGGYTLNLNMLHWNLPILIFALLGFVSGIPSNAYIVIVYLASIRMKEKLSPSDVIFLAKGVINVLLQSFLTLQGMLFVFAMRVLYMRQMYGFLNTLLAFLAFCNFWLTAWLSIHYFTIITNLRYECFLWLKRIVSNFLSNILILTTLGIFIVTIPGFWALTTESHPQSSENGTDQPFTRIRSSRPYLISSNIPGCIVPFCLGLLSLLLTLSFLLRHVWKVKSNDSESTRPNLRAHITALRTIFFLLCIFTFFTMTQGLMFYRKSPKLTQVIPLLSWVFRFSSPTAQAAIIIQASRKLKRINLRRCVT